MPNSIIQWICSGNRAIYEDLQLLQEKYNPKVVCLQETFIKENNQINLNNYRAYNHLHKDGLRASGGVSILVRKDVPKNQISIDSDLQVIAVKVNLHKSINICSIYILPHDPINESKLNNRTDSETPHIVR